MAALLVFYSHIAEQWVAKREVGPTPVIDAIDSVSSDAMHMGVQGIGQIGVPFFFLVSGFVVTPIALRMGQRRFAVNRVVRVYVPMFFVVLLTAGALWLGVQPLTGNRPELSWWTILTNMLVINYVIVPQIALVGVAWTLIVELIFYAVLVLLLPVLRRWVWLGIAVQLTLIFVVLMSAKHFGPSWFLFAVNFSYLPIPLIGLIVWATTAKKIPLWLGGTYAGLAWLLYVFSDTVSMGRLDRSYSLALACAVLFFLMGMFAEPKLRERKIWVALSERSYSIYLLHGLVAFATLDLLRPQVPLWVAVPIAVVTTFAVVEVSYRFVERPSHVLARRLSRPAAARAVKAGRGRPSPEAVAREAELGLAELRAEGAGAEPVEPEPVEAEAAEPEPARPPRRIEPEPAARRIEPDEVPAERTAEIRYEPPPVRRPAVRRVPVVEHPTQVIDALVDPPRRGDVREPGDRRQPPHRPEPEGAPEPRRRRRNDGDAAVTVQSLLAERAREQRDRR
ncbi:MAG: acyltransferase [Saccharothrix sp.]|nr:acyltransferase [Saccharothrix sp.]